MSYYRTSIHNELCCQQLKFQYEKWRMNSTSVELVKYLTTLGKFRIFTAPLGKAPSQKADRALHTNDVSCICMIVNV